MTTPSPQPRNPLHGITLEAMLTTLVAAYGWAGLGERIALRCFNRGGAGNLNTAISGTLCEINPG